MVCRRRNVSYLSKVEDYLDSKIEGTELLSMPHEPDPLAQ
jgi:hypothetical protein